MSGGLAAIPFPTGLREDPNTVGERLPIQAQREAERVISISPEGEASVSKPRDVPDPALPNHLRGSFDDNLAEHMDETDLSGISARLLQGIEMDIASRAVWESNVAKVVELMGVKLEDASPKVGSAGRVANVGYPLIMDAAIGFWSKALPELLPAAGPVKVRDDEPAPVQITPDSAAGAPGAGHNGGPELIEGDDPAPPVVGRSEIAEALEKDMNHYLTVVDRSYYQDYSRMLFSLGPTGTEFRKVFHCPIKKRPVSQWVKGLNLIISPDSTAMSDAGRITERIEMRQPVVKRLQVSGHWRNVDLTQPVQEFNDAKQTIDAAEGIDGTSQEPRDIPHTIYECYTELDLVGFEHEEESEDWDGGDAEAPDRWDRTALPLPYRITIDKTSRKVLEIRRNWREDDELMAPRQRYVMYGLVPGMGFYYYGYLHILGNAQRALTACLQMLLDAGMFASFPGFLIAKGMARQVNTDMVVNPGQGQEIDTLGKPIGDAVLPLPYKDPSAVLVQIMELLADKSQKMVGEADVPIGEGRADIPVGSALVGIEQAKQVMSAVHKGLHASQAEEFLLLHELFIEDPSALSRFAKNPARKWEQAEELASKTLVPASDPNVPSHVHRIMQAVGLLQMASSQPGVLSPKWVASKVMRIIGIGFDQSSFAPPQQGPQPDPAKMAAIQQKEAESQRKAAQASAEMQLRMLEIQMNMEAKKAENASRERIATIQEQIEAWRLYIEEIRAQRVAAHDAAEQTLEHANRVVTTGLAAHDQFHRHSVDRHSAETDRIAAMNPPAPAKPS